MDEDLDEERDKKLPEDRDEDPGKRPNDIGDIDHEEAGSDEGSHGNDSKNHNSGGGSVLSKGYPEKFETTSAKEKNEFVLYSHSFRKAIEYLKKMGADIKLTDNQHAIITGPIKLKGSEINATDLRGGAALVMAGLVAEGITTISNIDYILRGYENLILKLKNVGADIEIVDED